VRQSLTSLGAPVAATADEYVLIVDAVAQGNEVALNFIMCHALPSEAIDAGSKAEVFYAGVSPAKRAGFPAEGKWIREMVTADFMRQFWMPLESKLLIVKKAALTAEVKKETMVWYQKYLAADAGPR
jgi:hypothetical protein